MFILDESNLTGFVPDITRVLSKYNLSRYLTDFLILCRFPSKHQWKSIVRNCVLEHEEEQWHSRLTDDADFLVFRNIHKTLQPHVFWRLAVSNPNYKNEIDYLMKLISVIKITDCHELCHKCGKFYSDITLHIVLSCNGLENIRDEMWCDFINIDDITFSAYLHSLDDWSLLTIMLGGDIDFELNCDDTVNFRLLSIRHIYKMIHSYYRGS